MRILLINPPMLSKKGVQNILKKNFTYACIGLEYLAAILIREGHEAKIVDLVKSDKKLDKRLKQRWDIIGLTVLTPLYSSAKTLIKKIKRTKPNTKIVVG